LTDISDYSNGEGADLALVADLATDLAVAQSTPLYEGPGFAVLRDGSRHEWADHLDRPRRRTGTIRLTDPASFADLVLRNVTTDTVLYASRDDGCVTAVFDDHPSSDMGSNAAPAVAAGYRRDRVVLALCDGDDWREWASADRRPLTQVQMGDHVDMLAHTMVEPDAATMLEIATTLSSKSKIDLDSRVNLGTGAMTFSLVEDTQVKAGRTGRGEIEIPRTIAFECVPWRGSERIRFEARFRVTASRDDGVRMLYAILRREETLDSAFRLLIESIREDVGDLPILFGSPS
jgi:hypothetical protein